MEILMTDKRETKRIDVDLWVTVKLAQKNAPDYPLLGKLENLSADGMRVSFPFWDDVFNSSNLSFILNLPRPFSIIKGKGEIQWKHWDARRQRTTCGIKIANLDQQHLRELQDIIAEVRHGQKTN